MTAPEIYNQPSKPKSNGASVSGSQRDRRFTDTFYDTYKHAKFPNGRPFCGQREFQSGSETESINAGFLTSDLQCGAYFCDNPEQGQTLQERAMSLASAWTAPWTPMQHGGKKYMQFNYRRKIITFDYIRGERDEQNESDKYYQAAAKMSAANGWGPVQRGVMPSYQITAVMNEPPKFVPIWQAARAGDPWLMGAVDEPNERLAMILGLGEIQYFGGHEYGDSQYVAVKKPEASEPLVTADKILSVPMDQVAQMIADALAAHEAAKKKEAGDRMAKARAAKKPAGAHA